MREYIIGRIFYIRCLEQNLNMGKEKMEKGIRVFANIFFGNKWQQIKKKFKNTGIAQNMKISYSQNKKSTKILHAMYYLI